MAGTWISPTQYQGDDTNESVTGTDLAESYRMDEGEDAVNAGGGDDYADGGLGSDTLHGNAGNDTLVDINSYTSGYSGLIGHDVLYGDEGDDNLVFNSVDTGDIANGGSGTDLVTINFASPYSGTTTDGISFTLGSNTACYVGGILALNVSNCERVDITGSDGADTFTGGGRDDTLSGGAGNDTLQGLGGNDRIDPGKDLFYADGGAGVDILVLNLTDEYDPVSIALSASITVSGNIASGTALNFEQLDVQGGHGGDTLTGGKLSDTLLGGDGDNQISGGGGDDTLGTGGGHDVVDCGAGDDRVNNASYFYNPSNDVGDVVYGGAGADRIFLAGATAGHGSYVDGGVGDDHLDFNYRGDANSSNTIIGGDGNDLIVGGVGKDIISGDDGNDTIAASTAAASITGGSGDDIVNLSAYAAINPNQVLDGGTGYDELALSSIHVSGTLKLTDPNHWVVTDDGVRFRHFENFYLYAQATAASHIITGDGADSITMNSSYGATVEGGGGNDTISAYGSGAYVVSGGGGDDRLYGYAANAKLSGGDGADTLIGFSGAQTETGGLGADSFTLWATYYSTVAAAGRDTITDFSHADGDKINLLSIDADTTLVGNDAFHLVSAFGGHAGELVVSTESKHHYLVQGDVDGDGAADFAIAVNGHAAPIAGDFVL